jgi:uncharacterized repeat protein (TIGR01451 family)
MGQNGDMKRIGVGISMLGGLLPQARARACAAARCLALLLLLAALLPSGAHAQAPAPGTVITNTATVSYVVSGTGQTITNFPSNDVSVLVAQISAFTLTNSQTRVTGPNSQVIFSHTITNTGNGSDRFSLTLQSPAPGCGATCTYTFSSVLLAPDVAPQDGTPDGVPQPTLTTPLLARGQAYTFVVVTQVPASATGGQVSQVQVNGQGDAATATAGGFAAAAAQNNVDQANVSVGAVVNIAKALSTVSGPSPGSGNITVTLTYTNNSGVAATNVHLQDWIGQANAAPADNTSGLRYVAGTGRWTGCSSGTAPLTDANDGNETSCGVAVQHINYQTVALSATPGVVLVDAVIDTVPANTSGQLTFQVQVISGLSSGNTLTNNIARMSYCDVVACGTTQTADSNPALYTVLPATGIDLTLAKTVSSPASGAFAIGNAGEFTLQASNIGNAPSSGVVTVTDTLPGGLQVSSISAPGWACTQSGAYTNGNATGGGVTVSCTTSSPVPAAGQAPAIRIAVLPTVVPGVLVIASGPGVTLTNSAAVSGGSEPAANNGNNTGQVNVNVSLGASITGRVWFDLPASASSLPNRMYDAGLDRPLANWKVELLDPSSLAVVASATTSSAAASMGTYTFSNLVPGTYLLQFRDPTNNIVSGTPTCANTAAAADPNSTALGGPNYGGSFNPANCQTPTGGAGSPTNSQLDTTGRYLRITLQGGESIVDQNLPIDPSGIVYDASSGAAVAGAKVTITALNATTRAPLSAAQFNPSTGFVGGVSSWITGTDGFYQFLLTFSGQTQCALAPGGACLLEFTVTPPGGYQPFSVSTALFPPSASTGNCVAFAPNCLDASTGVGLLDSSGISASLPPISTSSKYYLRVLLSNAPRDVINNNFPLVNSAVAASNLLVQKKANHTDVDVGDFVDYTVTVANNTVINAAPTIVTDRLPAGFKYIAGTTRFTPAGSTTAVAAPDPAGGAGPILGFNVGTIAAGASITLTYRIKLSINAPQGDGKNYASAAAPGLSSNTAIAVVKVHGGVFDDKGYIVGTVFMDCNRDRVQGEREPGIPGVRLFMEDGTMVVTDSEGKYSLYGITPRTHVMKIDEITLPKGAEMEALNNRNAGVGTSRFVDVTNGEMARADFAEGSCAPEVLNEVKARRAKGETGLAELNRLFGSSFTPIVAPAVAPTAASATAAGTVASGFVAGSGTTGTAAPAVPSGTGPLAAVAVPQPGAPVSAGAGVQGIPNLTAGAGGTAAVPDANRDPGVQKAPVGIYNPVNVQGPAADLNSSNSRLPPKTGDLTSAQLPDVATAPNVAKSLEDLLPGLDNSFGILELKDGDTLPIAQTNIRIKGNAGTRFVLTVNGAEVPESRIGKRSTLQAKNLQAWEYIGVTLKAGVNTVVAKQMDPFGNVRGEISMKLIAPGNLGKISIDLPESAAADGTTPVEVKVRLTDENGVPVTARTAVTLITTRGRWDAQDLNPAEPGTQMFISGGSATVRLVPSSEPGDADITAIGGNLRERKKIAFIPYLRPLTGAGIVEGAFSLNSLSLKNMVAAQSRDGFEQQIQRFSYASSDGKRDTAARAAFFLKGKILGSYLLTMAYDSDKDLKDRVFRDINPDEFYPIYGDASTRGFDGQTSGRFYVRIDKGRNFVLYGDYNTASTVPARMLSQYSRSLTGAKVHLEDSSYQVNAFASRDTFNQKVVELPANGTSGPFSLNLPSGAVINSDKVEILTRDRYQPAIILSTVTKMRFADYDIEPYSGTLLFTGPIATLDANFNPQSIRVTYEIDQGGSPYWVGGVDGQYKITDKLEVGGMIVKDQNPGAEFSMSGLNASYKITDKTIVVAEVARTDHQAPTIPTDLGGSAAAVVGAGKAERIELRHSDGSLDGRLYWGRSDANFDNPSSSLSHGREEAGGRISYRLTPSTALSIEALHTADVVAGTKNDALSLRVDHSFANGIKVEAGVRRVNQETPGVVDPVTGAASSGATTIASAGYTAVRGRVTVPVPGLPQASVFGEVEQSVEGDSHRLASIGGEYKFSQLGRLYARVENSNGTTATGGVSTDQKNTIAVVGVDTSVTKDTKAFSEYRARDTIDGASSEAAVGLRNNWQIANGLRLNTTFERVTPITRVTTNSGTAVNSSEATAVTGAIEYTANPLWKGSTRLEVRTSDASDSILSTAAIAYKLTREWSLLTRSTYAHTAVKGVTTGDQDRWRVQIGAAYRDVDTNRWNMITRYEHQAEKDTTTDPILKRTVDLVSLNFNYQPERSLILTGRFATKYVNEDSSGISSTSFGNLISGRATYDITNRWDVGVSTSLHTDGGLANRKIGLGVEVGYMVQENLWLSGGYNFFGFHDRDLQGADYTDRGVYVRMRYKFDESLFDWKRDAALRGDSVEKKQ